MRSVPGRPGNQAQPVRRGAWLARARLRRLVASGTICHSDGSVIGVDDLPPATAEAGTGAAGRLRPLAARRRGLRGFGHLLGGPGDSYQAGQAWPLEDLADVVERDDQFLEPV
jgi:hypothetical protein